MCNERSEFVRVNVKMKDLVEQAKRDGWTVSLTRKGHLRFSAPGRATVFGSGTPSDHRSIENIRGKLRRAVYA